MKKITSALMIFVFFVLFSFLSPVSAQTQYNAALLITSDNQQAVAGNLIRYDLVLNTLGNGVNQIDVQFLIRGPFDRESLSFNLHPEHTTQIHNSAPLTVVSYERFYENDDGVRVHVVLKSSNGKPFNEGSGAIPVYQVGLRTNGGGGLSAYIDETHTYVSYSDPSKNGYDNYTPQSRPRLITVMGTNVATNPPSPRPSTQVSYPSPTPSVSLEPTPEPESRYDEEFQRISSEIEGLKDQVNDQEERLTFVERVVQSLRTFFSKFF
jgi:hypothetical protein